MGDKYTWDNAEDLKLQLHDAIYRLRFYSKSLIHILSLSNSHNSAPSIQKNRGDKSHRVIVALNNYPWTRLSVRIIGAIKRQFFHMVTHVFDNSNRSQDIFAIDTWGAVICSLGIWSQAHAYDPSDHMETRLKCLSGRLEDGGQTLSATSRAIRTQSRKSN